MELAIFEFEVMVEFIGIKIRYDLGPLGVGHACPGPHGPCQLHHLGGHQVDDQQHGEDYYKIINIIL